MMGVLYINLDCAATGELTNAILSSFGECGCWPEGEYPEN
jgi:hypothetical protein